MGQITGNQSPQSHQPVTGSFAEPEELESLSLDLLRKRWRIVLGRSAPPRLPPKLMARILAWNMQVQEAGDLVVAHRAMLDQAAGCSVNASQEASAPSLNVQKALRPGTVLAREYGGVLHQVTVSPDGAFGWRGASYRSLSKVARAITGTNWNGPRFFGLKPKPRDQGQTRQFADRTSGVEGASP